MISTATIAGAVATAFAIRFFVNPRKKLSAGNAASDVVLQSNSSSIDPYNPSKRNGYLSWDDYFMAIAFLSAERSKDPYRQVGACLVSQDGIILGKNFWRNALSLDGIGYNGFPRGCSDDKLPWSKVDIPQIFYVCHAEVNCILNTNHASAAGQKLYVTMYPCNECAKVIIQSGVSEVIYFVEKSLENADVIYVASHKLLSLAGVKVRRHEPRMNQILLRFSQT
uniref:dCMP deaminase n=1 Tax=Lactuca sativa TaxID=4236 RepID=A0A9R1WHM5_LACSA|nr:hypothetical protein LSAT_V11C100012350 [Lactuca sativa]